MFFYDAWLANPVLNNLDYEGEPWMTSKTIDQLELLMKIVHTINDRSLHLDGLSRNTL